MSAAQPARDRPVAPLALRRSTPRDRRWHRVALVALGLVLLLVALHVSLGAFGNLSPTEILGVLAGSPDVTKAQQLAVDTRLPRALLALLAGAALGAAGTLLQALTRNPLASPDLIGVTAGAVAAVLVWQAFGPAVAGSMASVVMPLVATAGGLAIALLVYAVARRNGGVEGTRFLLVGILIGGVLGSVSTLALLFLGTRAYLLIGWLAGSLEAVTWTELQLAAVYAIPGAILLIAAIPRANALQLGDDVAAGLGQHRERDRFLVLLTVAVVTAGVVSIVGAIGFIGLFAPHLMRPLVGSDLRRLAPASALAGAVMVLAADLLARMLDWRWVFGPDLFPSTLPVGVYLTFFGVPFLMSLLWRRR